MTTQPHHDFKKADAQESDGLAGLAGAAVAGMVLAMGFVALMARVGGPEPVSAAVAEPAPVVEPYAVETEKAEPLYSDEAGAH